MTLFGEGERHQEIQDAVSLISGTRHPAELLSAVSHCEGCNG